jgi:pre-mRNA-splicing factor 18
LAFSSSSVGSIKSHPSGGGLELFLIFGILAKIIPEMDFLKAEIEKKRKLHENTEQLVQNKYYKRGDLERLREQQYLKQQKEREAKKAKLPVPSSQILEDNKVNAKEIKDKGDQDEKTPIEMVMLEDSVINSRFRARGHPIRYFGETDEDRMKRLHLLESEEPKLDTKTFKDRLDNAEKGLTEQILKGEAGIEQDRDNAIVNEILAIETKSISLDLYKHDPDFCSYLIIIYFKKVLYEWQLYLNHRADDEKQNPEGMIQTANYTQTAEHLRPLFKSLHKKRLAQDIVRKIIEMCYWMQLREYMKANDAYLSLSIGDAAWPIGVTMVGMFLLILGIHERKNRDKIQTSQVAHALNDETKRKVCLSNCSGYRVLNVS